MTEYENGNRYALHALIDKRAMLAGEIANLKKQLASRVSQLDHVDACPTIFEPGFDPPKIGLKRPRNGVKLFRKGKLGRLIIDALRRPDSITVTATTTWVAQDITTTMAPPVVATITTMEETKREAETTTTMVVVTEGSNQLGSLRRRDSFNLFQTLRIRANWWTKFSNNRRLRNLLTLSLNSNPSSVR